MNIKVVYHSSSGNTKKVAQAIAAAAKVSAEEIVPGFNLSQPVDLLFVGDGIYAGKMNKRTKAFLDALDGSLVKNAAVFGTYGGQDKVIADITALLKGKGINVCAESFVCKGQAWLFANRKHPNEHDLDGATKFGNDIIKLMENG